MNQEYSERTQVPLEEVPASLSVVDNSILPGFPSVGTTEDVASVLQLKTNAVRELCRTGQLKAIKCGALWRIPRIWLIRFINERAN